MFGEYEVVEVGVSGTTAIWSDGGMGNYPITAPSTDLAKQWQGWGTALKPAHEPAVLARKPLCGTVADNVMTWGVGALNIDGSRVGGESGRWPANVILDEDAATALDAQSGHSKSVRHDSGASSDGTLGIYGKYNTPNDTIRGRSDSGGASRFFYTAKASKAEREAGLDAPIGERANIHKTVKPLSLMRYLVRLVTPPGGKVLDPFMGSGSTGCAAVLEGFDFVGIDITPEYVAIAQKRIDHYAVTSPLMNL
jgi:site-specific DNA-methyltransferase (adenine-specific)